MEYLEFVYIWYLTYGSITESYIDQKLTPLKNESKISRCVFPHPENDKYNEN